VTTYSLQYYIVWVLRDQAEGGGEAGRVRGAWTPCGDTLGATTPCVVSKWKMGRKDGTQSTMAKYHHSLGVKTAEMEK